MYPKACTHQQAGFLIPLTLFILVVMSLFALVLTRNTIQTSNSAIQEVISVQTLYTAESGAQNGMQELFKDQFNSKPITRIETDKICLAMNKIYPFAVTGLKNCSATVTCSCLYQTNNVCVPTTVANYSSAAPANVLYSFYKISSLGTCGSGNFKAVRTVEVGSYLKQE